MTSLTSIANTLGLQVKRLRMTKERLQKDAGLSKQTLTNVFSGNKDYRVTTLLAVADRLGMELVLVPKGVPSGAISGEVRKPAVPTLVSAALDALRVP